jgi:3',5'-cyclic AMP phosphodiesterase CpdA
MKRYKVIALNLILLTALSCTAILLFHWIGKTSDKDTVFYITNDIHYLANELTDHGEAFQTFYKTGDGKQLEYIDEIVDAFTEDIGRTKPAVLIISGDLTSNGEKKSHQELAEKLAKIEATGTAVYVIPGNHDILNPWARGFKGSEQYVTDYIEKEDFSSIYADFGYKEAISRDTNTLSYLATPTSEVWLLMLDTAIYDLNLGLNFPEADGRITDSTMQWIRECSSLAKENGARIITVMHHNILNHSDVIRSGFTLNDNEAAVQIFKENSLNLVFSGHIHVQDISSDRSSAVPLYDIANSSLAVNPHQYGVLKYSSKDGSFDYSTERVDVEGWAKRNGIKDENLLNFKAYAEDYFGGFAYARTLKKLAENTELTEDQKAAMVDTMRQLNVRYFAGLDNEASEDILQSEGYRLWKSLPEGFNSNYLDSMMSDHDTEDNSLHIEAINQ